MLSETLNFSQVAEQLGISQPSLSKQILNLEKELGVKLFDRNHSPLTLTPAGEYFMLNAKELLYKEDQILKALDDFKSGDKGQLTIGVTPFRSLYLMPEIIKEIRKKFPGVKVTLQEVNSTQIRKEATEGKYDFAIVNLPVDSSILEVTPLEADTLVLAVPNSLTHYLSKSSEDLILDFKNTKELPFVVLGPNQELRQLFDNLCLSADFSPNIATEVVGVATAWAMARAGVGAALLPLQFVKNQYFDQNLKLYKIKNNLYSRQPAIVTRRGQYLSEYAKYAIELLTK